MINDNIKAKQGIQPRHINIADLGQEEVAKWVRARDVRSQQTGS